MVFKLIRPRLKEIVISMWDLNVSEPGNHRIKLSTPRLALPADVGHDFRTFGNPVIFAGNNF
jgi:hypothetical protein